MDGKVIKIAVISRLFSWAAQMLLNSLIQDYDLSEDVTCLRQSNTTQRDRIISYLFNGFTKWDAVYFLDIAQHGYQYEQNMAFFPLTPLLFHICACLYFPIQYIFTLSDQSITLLAAATINLCAFIFATLSLSRLTYSIFRSKKFAFRTVLFFCLNPASVFFSVAYSECIFAMMQFSAMYFLATDHILVATLLFALGTSTRSNGLVSVGFIAYKILKQSIKLYANQQWYKLLLNILTAVLCTFVIVAPFLLYQYYGYLLFCDASTKAPPWCTSKLPLPYSYIQKHYWNVGFLKYFEIKQLPNFLLASPLLVIYMIGTLEYVGKRTTNDILTLGLSMPDNADAEQLVHFAHISFLVVFGVTSMHVQIFKIADFHKPFTTSASMLYAWLGLSLYIQYNLAAYVVLTRFVMSSSPLVYWLAAKWTMPQSPGRDTVKHCDNVKSNFIFIYFLTYYWLGFLLHCNFYPWT